MSNDNGQNSIDLRNEIFQLMNETLGLDDLKTLCFMLGNEYDNLPGEGKSGKIRELIQSVERQGTVKILVATLSEYRPNVKWPPAEGEETTDEASPELSEREIELIVRGLKAVEARSNERMGLLAKELVDSFKYAASSLSYPNIEGKWASSVIQADMIIDENFKNHVVNISQIGSSVTLEGRSEGFNWTGNGRLISNILIFRWELDNKENGINIMTVMPDSNIIEGKWLNHLGVSGADMYKRLSA